LDAIYNTLVQIKFLLRNRQYGSVNLINDYASMARVMNDPQSFPLKFKDTTSVQELMDDIKEKHDAITAVYHYVSEKANVPLFKKEAEKCKKWEYSKDGFTVITPEHPGDLAIEGIELHHCVKNYISKVVEGKTNIMFIRKDTDLKKPFFTVEILNKGSIEQVHGFGNKNAHTEPGLEDFIKDWAKEKKLKLTGYNKIR
jgi:hypothetical protein